MSAKTSYEEQILKAVDILAQSAMQDLKFDKSILATVESVENIATGEHKVKFQDGSFSAFTTSPGLYYAPGSLVYVQIPESDFSNKKIITGGKTELPSSQFADQLQTFINDTYPTDSLAWIQSWWTLSTEDPEDKWPEANNKHEGDLWYQTDTYNYYRYNKISPGVYRWEPIEGINAINGLLSNENTSVIGSSTGVVTNLISTQGIFFVYEGSAQITTGVVYSVVPGSEIGCTATIDANGSYRLTAFSSKATVASVVFKAVFRGVSIEKTFSITKIVSASSPRIVKLESLSYVTTYEADGQFPSPMFHRLTATPVNTVGAVYYEFFVDGVLVRPAELVNTFVYYVPDLWMDTPETITVKIREGASTGVVLASDSITISGIKPGTDGTDTYKVEIVTSEGNVFKNGEGTDKILIAKLYYGGTEIDASGILYAYSWSKYDNVGMQDLTFNNTGKSITIDSQDVNDMATFSVEVNEIININ